VNTELFIRRPVMTSVLMLAILVFGILGYSLLSVSDLPNVDFPTIQVTAGLPGASPETMASTIATPLEKQFTTIAGLDELTSTSSLGSTNITLQFSLSRNINSAALDVQSAITAAASELPANLPTPPTLRKVNPTESPILFLGLTSRTLPLYTVDQYAEVQLGEQISRVPGVAEVEVFGSVPYAVRVQVNPEELASRQLGIDQVASAIQNANVTKAMGTLYGPNTAYNLESNGQLNDAAAYRPLIVAYRNGAPVRLDQVAKVSDSVEDENVAGWVNGVPGVVLAIERQPGANTIDVVKHIRALFPRFRAIMPPSLTMTVELDRSISILQSVNDVRFTLLLAVCLVVLVIFLFLRNLSATLIPSFALPMAILGTFAVMDVLGYTIDNLSLLALTLSVGFVVDDAIVMLENIVRHMEMGKRTMQAAIAGSKEIGFTILSMTCALSAVFIPVFFMGGILGRLLHEFSVVIISAVLVSGVVSLTLTPMLCSRYLSPEHEKEHGRLYRALEGMLNSTLNSYGASLRWAMRHRVLVMLFGLFVLVGTAWEFWIIPKGFLPVEDMSTLRVSTEAKQGISFAAMKADQEALNRIILQDPNTLQFHSSISDSGGTGLNNGRVALHVKDLSEREWTNSPEYDRLVAKYGSDGLLGTIVHAARRLFEHHMTIQELAREYQPKFDAIPGLRAFIQIPPAIQIGGRSTKSEYQYTLESPDAATLYRYAAILEAGMKQLPGLVDVTTDLQNHNPQANVVVDRDQASALGITPDQVESALYAAYGQDEVSNIYTPTNLYKVVLQVEPKYQTDPGMLSELYIRSSSGKVVPLSVVSKFVTNFGPLTVNHTGQLPSVTLSFGLSPGVAIGQVVDEVQALASSVLPESVTGSFQGTAQAFQQSLTGLGILLAMAVLVIYMVLAILYESFIHPITILTGLPAAAFGGLFTLSLLHMQLDLFGFVGLIMLIGIVKKNAIMMVDFAVELQKSGHTAGESAYQGCMIRFRPIMMTTAAAIMGTMPIALGMGAGADERRPLGLCVVGGLIFAQFVTLYLTPVFYTYMDGLQRLGRRKVRKVKAEAQPVATHPEPLPAPAEQSRRF
jgi:hydrophobic/amphiphilic exporter-1 (mainly G- bacteria), HAE1 family